MVAHAFGLEGAGSGDCAIMTRPVRMEGEMGLKKGGKEFFEAVFTSMGTHAHALASSCLPSEQESVHSGGGVTGLHVHV